MIRSMTGYGRHRAVIDGREITVEIKSVNHRYFEFSARVPRCYMHLEDFLRAYMQKAIIRGKIEVNVYIDERDVGTQSVHINKPLLADYLDAIGNVAKEYGLRNDASACGVLRLPDVMTVAAEETDFETICAAVEQVANEALKNFLQQRETEGARLASDIIAKCNELDTLRKQIEAMVPTLSVQYMQRLKTRIQQLLGDTEVDESRLLTEVAIMADKTAIDEEMVRLASHTTDLRTMFEEGISNGKKMDFIIQEMNREINTTSSKVGDLTLTRLAIEIKALIEKIREQIQNIE